MMICWGSKSIIRLDNLKVTISLPSWMDGDPSWLNTDKMTFLSAYLTASSVCLSILDSKLNKLTLMKANYLKTILAYQQVTIG